MVFQKTITKFIAAGFLLLATACQSVNNTQASDVLEIARFEPEPATSDVAGKARKIISGREYLAVTANPHATNAAVQVLASGGSAIDAAIAAQMVLGLVEPQSSGIGGGGFLVYWDASESALQYFDGRESAPSAADETLFLKDPDTPLSFFEAVAGGRSVGVPGLLKMLEAAHDEHGHFAWDSLFLPAIELSENGFSVSPRLNKLISLVPAVDARPAIASYFFKDGEPLEEGALLKNPDYANSLRRIASEGVGAFYAGENARQLVKAVSSDANPGLLSLDDLQRYEAKRRSPVCKTIATYRICGAAPPSSGAVTVISILAIMEKLIVNDVITDELVDSKAAVSESAELSHFFAEASRLAFADRNTYLADPDFVDVPVRQLLSDEYIAGRAAQIQTDRVIREVKPGVLEPTIADSFIHAPSAELSSTTHMSIIDVEGDIVSMTSSIETAFGSRLMTGGYILNNQLTDFSFKPFEAAVSSGEAGKVANRVEAGKRPLSSMAPIIVFSEDNEPLIAIGSPGGKSIIAYVARTLAEVLLLGRDLEDAVDARHVVHSGNALVLEAGVDDGIVEALEQKGHSPKVRPQSSGLHVLQRTRDGWIGVADSRREGVADGR